MNIWQSIGIGVGIGLLTTFGFDLLESRVKGAKPWAVTAVHLGAAFICAWCGDMFVLLLMLAGLALSFYAREW